MTSPQRWVIRMIVFVVVVAVICVVLIDPIRRAYASNYGLNSLILGVLFIGVVYNFRQVLSLYPEVAWTERFRKGAPTLSGSKPPRLLGSIARVFGEREKLTFSTVS